MATRAEKIAMINGIGTGEPNTAEEIRNILMELLDPPAKTIVIKDVSNSYITANFDGTGLGVNEEEGYAICNGANGTRNWAERVPLAYGGAFLIMGATGGSADSVVVAHDHTFANTLTGKGSGGIGDFASTASNTDYSDNIKTESTGVSGAGKNYQPYIVTLVTMKL
jgi:hypothetical protein